jgi:hypothetical protein
MKKGLGPGKRKCISETAIVVQLGGLSSTQLHILAKTSLSDETKTERKMALGSPDNNKKSCFYWSGSIPEKIRNLFPLI